MRLACVIGFIFTILVSLAIFFLTREDWASLSLAEQVAVYLLPVLFYGAVNLGISFGIEEATEKEKNNE